MKETWILLKARILAIFGDRDTLLLGDRRGPRVGVVNRSCFRNLPPIVMSVFLHRLEIPHSWPAIVMMMAAC